MTITGLWRKVRGQPAEVVEKPPVKWGVHRVAGSEGHGTGYEGELPSTVDYKLLKAVFGKPDSGSGDGKVRKSWTLSIDGVICTIYDWKTGRWPLKDIDDWHIGGHSPLSVRLVKAVIAEHREEIRCGYRNA